MREFHDNVIARLPNHAGHPMFSRFTISQKLSLGFGLIILIICIMVAVVRDAFSKIDEATNWNIHTYTVLEASNKLLISLTNIETGMRGFALSGDDDFLAPLIAGKNNFGQVHGELVKLTSDNPAQQQRLAELKVIQQKWFGEDIEGTVALRRSMVAGKATIDDVVKRIKDRQDKAKMDGMRKLIADLQQDEQKLLSDSPRVS
ncbi:CHASE3 domain-containing protein [Pseudomonas syringae]